MNLDTGAAVNTCPMNGPDGAGDGTLYRTASGGCIPDGGAAKYGEDGFVSISERKTPLVHTRCCAVLEKSRAEDDKISIWDPSVVS